MTEQEAATLDAKQHIHLLTSRQLCVGLHTETLHLGFFVCVKNVLQIKWIMLQSYLRILNTTKNGELFSLVANLRRTLTKCKVLGWMEQITGHGFTGTYQLSFPFYPRYQLQLEKCSPS